MMNVLEPDSDRAVAADGVDEFGFKPLAAKLAPSLVEATESAGMVIGIEGPWGSGKTSLLNFLKGELDRNKIENLHVIEIAPWLIGDSSSLVTTLLGAMGEKLDVAEQANQKQAFFKRNKKKASGIGEMLRIYSAKTGRVLSPLAKFAGNFLPGAAIAGDALDLGSDYLEKLGKNCTEAALKAEIIQRLGKIDAKFLVLVDDLDRLEPRQAVEIVRLVRSVADFPKVAYAMCYDRGVLAHALQNGLQVADGDLFLQKVVQLTFQIPLPEPFDLRISLREKLTEIYEKVSRKPLSTEEANDLHRAVDREGGALKTPRDIKLVLNGVRFMFPSIRDDVYFPDVCRVNLLKILNPRLYRWLEVYLSLQSVVFTGDAQIEDDEKADLGKQLDEMLPSKATYSTRSISTLSSYVLGVQWDEEPAKRVFNTVSDREVKEASDKKRLGSPNHYRYYFALTGPKTVMPESDFRRLLRLAETDHSGLVQQLSQYISMKRLLGKSWLEYLLNRLDEGEIPALNAAQTRGLILGLTEVMDQLAYDEHAPHFLALSPRQKAKFVVGRLIRHLRKIKPSDIPETLDRLFNAPSIGWLVGEFIRQQLWDLGEVGDRARPEEAVLTKGEAEKAIKTLGERLSKPEIRSGLGNLPDLGSFIWGWRDLNLEGEPRTWAREFTEDDDNLLTYLLGMRGWSMSTKITYPLSRKTVEAFLDWGETMGRLDVIEASTTDPVKKARVEDVREALRNGEGKNY
ncbi:P-loop NTPase fold protein [Rhizobium sp. BT03]|uniref:KAP family P-loop NTPase fold protein n=1 Tax=Rhizobium sp. BT03 TaxID=3045156 RepID=UPI0024B3DF33|nr:P-loop NTPase fold protein [Rhizobium sp. BT03]WHO76261.1 KAP family NTPase [Rhizobium sp. BT03]